jgi:type II secretory pathway pseudopilin PulG
MERRRLFVKRTGRQKGRGGLALVELLTVMFVISMLTAILIPMFMDARERSEVFRCQDRLREIGQTILMYGLDNKGRLPTTAASICPAIPDLSSGGRDAEDPFDSGGPPPNNVPAAMFLLVRTYDLWPGMFVCPATEAVPDNLAGRPRSHRSNFTDVRQNLSYSMQNPYASETAQVAGFQWSRNVHKDFVIMADLNPGVAGEGDDVLGISPAMPPPQLRLGNSNNHRKTGQNVLYIDGRVEFVSSPFVGVDRDNIYATRNHTVLDSPADQDDSILLPTDD